MHDLNARIDIARDAVRIESLSGFLDTGRFSVKGEMAHEGFSPKQIDLTLDAEALPLELPDTLSLLLNSRLTVSGGPEKCDVKGEIVILEGAYYKDVKFNLFEAATQPKRTVAPPASPLTAPFVKNMGLDIAVRNRDPLLIQNNLADLELKPDLHLGGTLNTSSPETYIFRKKPFKFKKGSSTLSILTRPRPGSISSVRPRSVPGRLP